MEETRSLVEEARSLVEETRSLVEKRSMIEEKRFLVDENSLRVKYVMSIVAHQWDTATKNLRERRRVC